MFQDKTRQDNASRNGKMAKQHPNSQKNEARASLLSQGSHHTCKGITLPPQAIDLTYPRKAKSSYLSLRARPRLHAAAAAENLTADSSQNLTMIEIEFVQQAQQQPVKHA